MEPDADSIAIASLHNPISSSLLLYDSRCRQSSSVKASNQPSTELYEDGIGQNPYVFLLLFGRTDKH